MPIPVSNGHADATQGNGVPEQELFQKMAIERKDQRRKKLLAQAAQLLALAQKLNANVAKSSANQLSVPAINEAEEIEKLAKSIKGKVENGY